MRDPFFRKAEVKTEEAVVKEYIEELKLILTGVQWVKGKAMAYINNKIYWEGDIVEGKRIVKIEKDYIVLRDFNKEYILRLGGKE